MPPASLNHKNPAVRRIMAELKEFARDPPDSLVVKPLEDNVAEIHFTFRGAPDSPYADGFYHGRLKMPPEYPFKPPSIYLSNPSGRFETDVNVCLNVLSHHPETWQPAWGIRTVLLALSGFMVVESPGSIGSLQHTKEERLYLAKKSHAYKCKVCGMDHAELKDSLTSSKPGEAGKGELAQLESVFSVLFAGTEAEKEKGKEPVRNTEPPVEATRESSSSTGEPAGLTSGAPAALATPAGGLSNPAIVAAPLLHTTSRISGEQTEGARRRRRRRPEQLVQQQQQQSHSGIDLLIYIVGFMLIGILLKRLILT